MVNALLILGFSIFSILLFLFIWFIRNRNKILADKNKEIAFLNENLKSKAITNQNITEAALHKSQQELSLIYNHTQDPMGLFQCDPLGNFLIESINQVYIDHLMGEGIISRDQSLEGLNLSVFLKTYLKLSAEDVAECMQYFNTARLSKRRVSYESITYSALNRDNIINKVTLSPIVDDATGLCNRIIFVLHGIKALLPSEAHSKTLLEHSPIIIWDEDFSAVKRYFDALSNDEIANLNTYFDQNPKELERLASLIIVKNVNQKSAGFYNRESKEAHIEEIPLYFVDESWKVLKEEFIALAQGATTFESEIPIKKLNGELVNLIITLSIPPEFKDTWKSVIVSFIDITQQKKAALELQVSEAHSKALFEHSPIIIWDEDLSLLKNYFDTLSKKEIANLDTFFDQNPKEFKRLAALIKVKNLNQKGLDFYELENKDAQINAMPFYFADESWEALKAEFIALAQGAATYEGEIPIIKPNGDAAQFIIKTSIPPQYRETWKSVIVSFIDITERKKTEKKLKQSKTELKTQLQHKQLILDTMLDGYTLTDKRANIIEANPAYCNMIGYTKEELLKMNIKQLSKQFSQTDIDHKSLDLVKGKGAHYEDILIRKDGTPIVVDIKTSFMQFNGIQRFATFIRDITAEKAVQQELEYRSSFEKLLANLSSGFLKISLGKIDPGIQNAIQQVCEFSGFDRIFIALFSEKQDTGSVLYEWHNSSRNSLKEDFQNVPMESFPWLFKTLINNEAILVKNQDDLPAEAINMRNIFQKMDIHSLVQVPMVWKEKIIGFICVDSRTEKQNLSTALTTLLRFTGEMITNVLQRKNKEEEIKTQLQRNQLILESTLDGYILFDKNANIIDVNQAYCKLVGYAKEELVKMNILDLDKISSKLETQARLKNVVENDGARYETRHERKDGTKVDLDTNLGTMIFNDKLLFAAFVRDITAQKAAQQ
ncbi:MAG: PAS domain S-box-containing protein, partial [Saprospiraceae bacterium]